MIIKSKKIVIIQVIVLQIKKEIVIIMEMVQNIIAVVSQKIVIKTRWVIKVTVVKYLIFQEVVTVET